MKSLVGLRAFRTFAALLTVILATGGFLPALAEPVYAAADPIGAEDFLHVNDRGEVVTETGEKVVLRGVNLGGWLLQEHWMSPIVPGHDGEREKLLTDQALYGSREKIPDNADTTRLWANLDTLNTLESRFGREQTRQLYDIYEANWITAYDLEKVAEAGCNVIRVPFWYRNFLWSADQTDGQYEWINGSFEASPGVSRLDWVIETACKLGLYVILDMHGAPGGQSLNHSTGTWGQNDLYGTEAHLALTEELWKKLSARYKDNPVVAAYDILNEPNNNGDFVPSADHYMAANSQASNDATNAVYDRMIKAIRNDVRDAKHIISVQGIWKAANLPNPKAVGWSNMMYQVHLYDNTGDGFWANAKETALLCKEYGVAAFVGEFNNAEGLAICENMANDQEVAQAMHWTTWTYKIGNKNTVTWSDQVNFSWYSNALELADVHADDFETIKSKWGETLRTESWGAGAEKGRMLSVVREQAKNAKAEPSIRDVVLVLDRSGSMGGTPISMLKQAVEKFCTDTLTQTSGTRVAIIAYNGGSSTLVDFTDDLATLTGKIKSLSATGGTDIGAALSRADTLLTNNARKDAIKTIVLLSDGLPEHGSSYTKADARYTRAEYGTYAGQASATYNTAVPLKPKYDIYTLGFFHSLSGNNLKLGQQLMTDIQNGGYYNVVDPNDLAFVFGNVAGAISQNDHPIIVLPGMFGSRLTNSGIVYWPPDDTLYASLPTVFNIDAVYLPERGGYGTYDEYKPLITALKSHFPDRDVILFGYDWRRSAYDAAQNLQRFIDDELKTDKVDIVAHSMGGLVAANYAADPANAAKIGTAITLGTPYEGAPLLLGVVELFKPAVENGVSGIGKTALDLMYHFGVNYLIGREFLAKFPGAADNAPTAAYADAGFFSAWKADSESYPGLTFAPAIAKIGSAEYRKYCDTLFSGIPYSKTAEQRNRIKNNAGWSVLADLPRSFFFVGDGHETINGFTFYADYMGIFDLSFGNGDGTVPFESATMLGTLLDNVPGERLIVRHGLNHGDLAKEPETLNRIIDLLESKNLPSGESVPNGKPYIVVRIACPVDVQVTSAGETLSSVSGAENPEASFGDLYIVGKNQDIKILAMDPGAYTVAMSGTGSGTMDYEARYFNEKNELVKKDSFTDVKVDAGIKIVSETDQSAVNTLKVDENGDGAVDLVIYPDGQEQAGLPAASSSRTPPPTNPSGPVLSSAGRGPSGAFSGKSKADSLSGQNETPAPVTPPIDLPDEAGAEPDGQDTDSAPDTQTAVVIALVMAVLAAAAIILILRGNNPSGQRAASRRGSGIGPGVRDKNASGIGPGVRDKNASGVGPGRNRNRNRKG